MMNQEKILHSSYGQPEENQYCILKQIGKGGFAKVYEGRHIKSERYVAIKEISRQVIQTQKLRERLNQEITIHKSLNHSSIVKFYDYCEDQDNIYLILELCTQGNLQELLQKLKRPLYEDEARKMIYQIVCGISYLQSKNIMHRDLKLSNLLIDRNGDIKIADFGLATQLKNTGQKNMTMCGTPNYISPEVATRSSHGVECDIWALGCITYTLLVGRPPFDTKSPNAVLTNVVISDYKIPSTLSLAAKELIDRCLKKNPKDRIDIWGVSQLTFFDSLHNKNDISHRTDSGVYTLSSLGTSLQHSRTPLSAISESLSNSGSIQQPVLKDRMFIYNNGSPPVKLVPEPSNNKRFDSLKQRFILKSDLHYPQYRHDYNLTKNKGDYPTDDWVVSAADKRMNFRNSQPFRENDISEECSRRINFQDQIDPPAKQWNSLPLEHSINNNYYQDEINRYNSNKKEDFYSDNFEKGLRSMGNTSPMEEIVYDRGKNCGDSHCSERSSSRSARHCSSEVICPERYSRTRSLERAREHTSDVCIHAKEHSINCQGCPMCIHKPNSLVQDEHCYVTTQKRRSWCGEEDKEFYGPKREFYGQTDIRHNSNQNIPPTSSLVNSNEERQRIIKASPGKINPSFYKSSNEMTPSKSKSKKILNQLCSPLSTRRLKSIRQKTNNAILHILDDGDVCIEFITVELKKEKVRDVCRISHDGQRIILYPVKNVFVSDQPAAIPEEGTDQIYSYENLPQKHFKKYLYAARFVKMVKARTAKVTYYSDQAKCILMENGPNPDFEALFYSGEKVILGKEKYQIIDANGDVKFALSIPEPSKTRSSSQENSIVHTLGDDVKPLYSHSREMRDHCLKLQEVITDLEVMSMRPNFPIVIGKRQSVKISSSAASPSSNPHSSLRGKENVSPESIPSTSRIPTSQLGSYEPSMGSVIANDKNFQQRKFRKPLSIADNINIQKNTKDENRLNKLKTKYGWLLEENGFITLRYFDGSYTEACIRSLQNNEGLKHINYFDSSHNQQSFYDERGKLNPLISHKLEQFQEVLRNVCKHSTSTTPSEYQKSLPIILSHDSRFILPKHIR